MYRYEKLLRSEEVVETRDVTPGADLYDYFGDAESPASRNTVWEIFVHNPHASNVTVGGFTVPPGETLWIDFRPRGAGWPILVTGPAAVPVMAVMTRHLVDLDGTL